MYFWKYRLLEIWLDKSLKSRVSNYLPWKKSLLVIHKIVRLFVNTLAVYHKYYLLNTGNLTQPIQMQLSQKQKTFSEFFFAFLKSILNFKHLPKKDDRHT